MTPCPGSLISFKGTGLMYLVLLLTVFNDLSSGQTVSLESPQISQVENRFQALQPALAIVHPKTPVSITKIVS